MGNLLSQGRSLLRSGPATRQLYSILTIDFLSCLLGVSRSAFTGSEADQNSHHESYTTMRWPGYLQVLDDTREDGQARGDCVLRQGQPRPTASSCLNRVDRKMQRDLHDRSSVTPSAASSRHAQGHGPSNASNAVLSKVCLEFDVRIDSCANIALGARARWVAQECAILSQLRRRSEQLQAKLERLGPLALCPMSNGA